MRQVKTRARAARKSSPGRGRGKAASRHGDARLDRRARRDYALGGEPRGKLFSGICNSVVFRRPMLALTLVAILVGGITGLLGGGYVSDTLTNARGAADAALAEAGFSVSSIELTGNEQTSGADIRAALDIRAGVPIFDTDPAAARRRLLRLPWVADAEVRRDLPDRIAVHVVEKRPFALWRDRDGFWVVERSGNVITEVSPRDFSRLPMLLGNGAPEAAATLIDALLPQKAISARLVAVQRIGERRWDLHLSGGVIVRLPENGWETQLGELEWLIVERGVLERDIEMIDLRYPDNYVFRLHNGDSRPVPRERRA